MKTKITPFLPLIILLPTLRQMILRLRRRADQRIQDLIIVSRFSAYSFAENDFKISRFGGIFDVRPDWLSVIISTWIF